MSEAFARDCQVNMSLSYMWMDKASLLAAEKKTMNETEITEPLAHETEITEPLAHEQGKVNGGH